MLESMWDDPIINHSKQKIKTDILLINTHTNLISEDHLIEQIGKKKHQLFRSNMPPEIDNDKVQDQFLQPPNSKNGLIEKSERSNQSGSKNAQGEKGDKPKYSAIN